MIAQWENECISLSVLSVAWVQFRARTECFKRKEPSSLGISHRRRCLWKVCPCASHGVYTKLYSDPEIFARVISTKRIGLNDSIDISAIFIRACRTHPDPCTTLQSLISCVLDVVIVLPMCAKQKQNGGYI